MMIISFCVSGFAGKKVYGPVLDTMETAEVLETGGEFKQRFLVQDENNLFGVVSDKMPIFSVELEDEKNRIISLTFDSSWIDYYTIPLLDLLDRYHAKATFFLTAFYIRQHPNSVKEILRRGHEIGNHSNTHRKFTDLSENTMREEVDECHKALKELTGIDMCLFRFPYGSYNSTAIRMLKEKGYYPIQWEVDSLDWKNESAEAILTRLKAEKAYKAGNIILFHNGGDFTVEALRTVFHELELRKLKCVRVSDLIYDNGFYIGSDGKQKKLKAKED